MAMGEREAGRECPQGWLLACRRGNVGVQPAAARAPVPQTLLLSSRPDALWLRAGLTYGIGSLFEAGA